MASTSQAIVKLISNLRRTGQICKVSLEAVQRGEWSDEDFSAVLYAQRRAENHIFTSLLLTKIQQQNVLSSSQFNNILRFAIDNKQRVPIGVFASWAEAISEARQYRRINYMLSKLSLPVEILHKFDKSLASGSIECTTTDLANLVNNLVWDKFQYSPEAYTNLLNSAMSLWFPSRELSNLLYALSFCSLPPESIRKYLEHFSGQVESKALSMTPMERARILAAYTITWSKASEKILAFVIREADLGCLTEDVLGMILLGCSQNPTFDDDYLFAEMEPKVLAMSDISKSLLLNLVAAYANRQYPSPQLYAHLKNLVVADPQPCVMSSFYLTKHLCCTREDKVGLEIVIKDAMKDKDLPSLLERVTKKLQQIREEKVIPELTSFLHQLQ